MSNHNTPACATKRSPAALRTLIATCCLMPSLAMAAPVTVSFTSNTFGTGSLAGAGPISGSFTFDSEGTDLNGSADIGLYSFSGLPYGFLADITNFGTLSASSVLVQVGDNGQFLPNMDTVQIAGNSGNYEVRIDWSAPMDTFSGDGIPDLATLGMMSPLLVITNSLTGFTEWLAPLSDISYSTAPVPVPSAVWLFASGLGVMGWLRRKAA